MAHAETMGSRSDEKEEEKKSTLTLNVRTSKKPNTSFFWKEKRAQPTGEVDMATFLFYFSSPIDSQAMNQNENENEEQLTSDNITDYTHNNADQIM